MDTLHFVWEFAFLIAMEHSRCTEINDAANTGSRTEAKSVNITIKK